MDLASDMLRRAEGARAAYLDDLEALVGIDSGSHDPEGVRRVADWVAARLVRLGFDVDRRGPLPDPVTGARPYGDAVIGRRRGIGSQRIMLFAHMDTVFERGDAAARPFSIDDAGLAHGPGVTDDKAGVVAGLHAAAHLIAAGAERYGELVLVLTPDEEIGSPFGRQVLTEVAQDADAALCLECARENGDLVASRKGVVDLEIEVLGVAAHSGIEPERGAHAGLEAAHLTVFLQELADAAAGITVNVGVIRAGERLNIVPDRARLSVEIRATAAADLERVMRRIRERAAAPLVAGTRVELIDVEACPPMEPTPAGAEMGALAAGIAERLGFGVRCAATGGVSDANRVAALGVPALDGLGPVGGGDHTVEEWLDIASVPQRVALLAALIDTLGATGAAAAVADAGRAAKPA